MKAWALAGAAVLLLTIVTVAFLIQPKAAAYPLPAANISVSLPPGLPYKQLTSGTRNDEWPAWSPNGNMIAYASSAGGLWSLWVMDAKGTHARQVSAATTIVSHPTWSPDSSRVAYWCMDGQVQEFRVVNVTSGATFEVPGSSPYAIQGRAEWSPDGSRLVFFADLGRQVLVLYDFRQGTSVVLANATEENLGASWASNDQIVFTASVSGKPQLLQLSVSSGAVTALSAAAANYSSPAVSSNGTIAYYSDLNPGAYSQYQTGYGGFNVWVSPAGGGNATFQYLVSFTVEGSFETIDVPFIPGAMDLASPPAWNPGGTIVAYSAYSSPDGYNLYLWDITKWTTTAVGPVGAGAFEPSWSPDGVNLAFSSNAGGTYHIWVLNTSGAGAAASSGAY